MIYPVIGWLLSHLDAPLWVWAFFIAKIATEIYSLPFYGRLIRRDRSDS